MKIACRCLCLTAHAFQTLVPWNSTEGKFHQKGKVWFVVVDHDVDYDVDDRDLSMEENDRGDNYYNF